MSKRYYEKHGMTGTRTYAIWKGMKGRCLNENRSSYHRYGGRGITVCKEWQDSFMSFLSDMGECPKDYTLERIDNNKGYSAGNCKWVSRKEQANNRNPSNRSKAARVITPDGLRTVVKAGFVAKFCDNTGLDRYRIYRVLSGESKTHKGWTGKYL